jgi:predicted GIY-YIG superfamily endonuclease
MNKWYVYEIIIDGIRRYVGITMDVGRRQTNHNYLCFKKVDNKELYLNIRNKYPDLEKIELKELREFKGEVDARRWECYLILKDYFNEGNLWQKVPIIKDGNSKFKKK